MLELTRVCVFCGSSTGNGPAYARAAKAFGRVLAQRGLGLVYGGGSVGLMGVVAEAALAAGGEVIGVIPDALSTKEITHDRLGALHVVPSMHARKAKMAELADAFVALPGGYGTLEELFEVITWAQLGLHRKPIALLNVGGFFDGLLRYIDAAVSEGFVRHEHRGLVLARREPEEVIDALEVWEPILVPKWIRRAEET